MSDPIVPPRDYSTREKRIGNVAYYYGSFTDSLERWRKEGFSDEELFEGLKLGAAMRDEYESNRAWCGDPAYGSWPANVKQPIRDKVLEMIEKGTR